MKIFDESGFQLPVVGSRVSWYSRNFKRWVQGQIKKIVITRNGVSISIRRDNDNRLVERKVFRYNSEIRRSEYVTIQERIRPGVSVIRNYRQLVEAR